MKSYVIYGLHGIAKNKLRFQPTPLSLRELWFSFFLLFFECAYCAILSVAQDVSDVNDRL